MTPQLSLLLARLLVAGAAAVSVGVWQESMVAGAAAFFHLCFSAGGAFHLVLTTFPGARC